MGRAVKKSSVSSTGPGVNFAIMSGGSDMGSTEATQDADTIGTDVSFDPPGSKHIRMKKKSYSHKITPNTQHFIAKRAGAAGGSGWNDWNSGFQGLGSAIEYVREDKLLKFLKSLGLEYLYSQFEDRNISFENLMGMTEREIGQIIYNRAAKNKILDKINDLKDGQDITKEIDIFTGRGTQKRKTQM
mmetsp:Transcript_19277/g.21839  ORF Transcript_19277/g.21839 Transcript_19277/m.21839 type:complete len:187 (-) Transcript_19277:1289-1849(-)